MFCYKIHETQFGNLVAICDKDLNGKTLDNKGIEFFIKEGIIYFRVNKLTIFYVL